MKIFLQIPVFAVLALLVSASETVPRFHDEYDPEKWPKAELKLSTAATLKDVFDSGLRPYRFPGLENTTLEVKHLELNLELGSKNRLPAVYCEMIRIKPYLDGEIATIEGFTPKLTLEQSRKEMVKWLPYGTNQRRESDLDEYLEAARTDFLDFDNAYRGIPHGCSVSWKEPGWKTKGGGPQVVAWFRKTASEAKPLRLHFKLLWSSNRPRKDRGTYHPHPIKPPPGYEDIDMTAPEKFGPDSAAEIMKAQGLDIGESSDVAKEKKPAAVELTSKRGKDFKLDGDRAQKKGIPGWVWFILAMIALGICAVFLRTKKKRPV